MPDAAARQDALSPRSWLRGCRRGCASGLLGNVSIWLRQFTDSIAPIPQFSRHPFIAALFGYVGQGIQANCFRGEAPKFMPDGASIFQELFLQCHVTIAG